MWRLVIAVALFCSSSEGQIPCRNDAGAAVDWYILYKLPNSFNFYYMDSTMGPNYNMIHNPNNHPINHQAGVLANTLQPYFNRLPGSASGYLVYNDQPHQNSATFSYHYNPRTATVGQSYGHSKGFVMTDATSGFWLLHSTPNFPSGRASNNFFPPTGNAYAQTFICVTFPYATFQHIGQHLQYINAYRFDHEVPNGPTGFHQGLQDAANGARLDPNTPPALHQNLPVGQQPFRSFFKRTLQLDTGNEEERAAVADLYVAIAENINSDLFVQHWGRQTERSGHYTAQGEDHVFNVECIQVGINVWRPTDDHSKWAVSADGQWTCFGDSNRAVTQYRRPGGALCINNQGVTAVFRGFIQPANVCP